MTSVIWELEKAVAHILLTNNDLQNIAIGMYHEDNTAFPLIVPDNFECRPWNTFGKKGKIVDFNLRVYSDYNGNKEVLNLQSIIENALDLKSYGDIDLDSGNLVSLEYIDNVMTRDSNNDNIFQNILHYRARIEE